MVSSFFYFTFLPSENPDFLNLYSFNKFMIIVVTGLLSCLFIFFYKFIFEILSSLLGDRISFGNIKKPQPYHIFIILSVFFHLPLTLSLVYLTGDITLQLTPALHKAAGLVNDYNSYLTIHTQDWSQDEINHITWWPPGFLYLINLFFIFGIALGPSLKMLTFSCIIIGGCGFLKIFQKIGFSNTTILIVSVLLPFYIYIRDGLSTHILMTVDFLGFAIFPWLIFLALNYLDKLKKKSCVFNSLIYTALLFILLGTTYYIKNTLFLYACGLSTYICLFVITKHFQWRRIILGLSIIMIASVGFLLPIISLEYRNYSVSGSSVLTSVANGDSGADWYNEMYGDHYTESTDGWQIWASILTSPGFLSFGHSFFINGSYFISQLDWVNSLIDQIDLNINNIIFAYMLFGLIGNFLLIYLGRKYRHLLPGKYLFFILTMFVVSITLLAYHSYMQQTANSLLNFDARYRTIFNILIEVAIIEILVLNSTFFNNLKSRVIFLTLAVISFSYPLFDKTIFSISHLKEFLQDDSIQTVNGIRGEGDNVFEVNRALLSHQNEENTLLIFYAQHSNIAPFNFAVKTYFAHKERDLDQLFHNYKSSKNMRILLLSDGMTELRDEKWEHWQRLIHSQEKWTHARFKTKHYKLSFIDTKATFLSDD